MGDGRGRRRAHAARARAGPRGGGVGDDRAADVVRSAYRAAGGGALHLSSPLQRRLRDIDAVTQHFLVRTDTLTTAGALLAGQEPGVPIF